MLKAFLEFLGMRKTNTQLEDEAWWNPNTGEPCNEAARELCRRWGEHDLLDVNSTQRAQAQKDQV